MTETSEKSMMTRLLEGKERTDVTRKKIGKMSTLFKDILKGRFGRLVLVNLLLLLSFSPVIAIYAVRFVVQLRISALGPYGSGLTFGYPIVFDLEYGARMQCFTDLFFFALYIPAAAIAAVGLAGLANLCRCMLLTEGVFSMGDFGRGIKRNYAGTLGACLLFAFLLFAAQTAANYADWTMLRDPSLAGAMIFSKTVGYLLVTLSIPVSLNMIVLCAGYKLGFFGLLRSALVMTVRHFPYAILFSALTIAPVFLVIFGSSLFFFLGAVYYLVIGFSLGVLLYSAYARWAFDRFVPPEVKAEQPEKVTLKEPEEADVRITSVLYGKSNILSRPVPVLSAGRKPLLLGEDFTRADLLNVEAERRAREEELMQYERAHEGEEGFVEYNLRFERREKMIDDGGKKKKKVRPPKMLNSR